MSENNYPEINLATTYEVNKVCVFCGEKPTNKTKEHIIPEWLIELTGDINRDFTISL
jgi:hypothetical protein